MLNVTVPLISQKSIYDLNERLLVSTRPIGMGSNLWIAEPNQKSKDLRFFLTPGDEFLSLPLHTIKSNISFTLGNSITTISLLIFYLG